MLAVDKIFKDKNVYYKQQVNLIEGLIKIIESYLRSTVFDFKCHFRSKIVTSKVIIGVEDGLIGRKTLL